MRSQPRAASLGGLFGTTRASHVFRVAIDSGRLPIKLPHRRHFLHLAAGAAALPVVSRIARAQTYPTRPVRLVVGFPPGGAGDIAARLMGQWLSERFGQPFVVENRPGAGGNIATETVVRAPADGYTFLLIGAWNAINATLYDRLNFNFIRDIARRGSDPRAVCHGGQPIGPGQDHSRVHRLR
jgi:Tripartite tricarboxylate transporter family receptor